MKALTILSALLFLVLIFPVNASYLFRQNMTVANLSFNVPTYRIFNVTFPSENCSDMTFYNASQTEILPYMIDANTTAGVCSAWIRTDNLQNYRYNTSSDGMDNSNPCSLYNYDSSLFYAFEGNPSAPLYNSKCGIGNATSNTYSGITLNGKFQYGYIGFGTGTSGGGLGFPFPGNFNNQNFTVMGWIYMNDSTSETGFGFGSSNCEMSMNPNQIGAGKIRWFNYNHASLWDNYGTPMTDTLTTATWQHVAFVTSNGTNGAGEIGQIYFNGTNVQNFTSATITTCFDAGNTFYIGSGGSGGLPTFKGLWDHIKVYNRALSQAEIRAEYAGYNVTYGEPASTIFNTAPNITVSISPSGYCDYVNYNLSVFVWDNETNNVTVLINLYRDNVVKETFTYPVVVNNSQWQINTSTNWTAYQNFYLTASANDSLTNNIVINQTINHCVPAAAATGDGLSNSQIVFIIILVLIITALYYLATH